MLVHDSQATVTHSQAFQPLREEQTALEPEIFETFRTTIPGSALLEIYAVFLSDTRKRLALLGEVEAPGTLSQVVHAIRGSAGMLGATAIASLAEQLDQDPEAPSRLLTACDQLQAILRAKGLAL